MRGCCARATGPVFVAANKVDSDKQANLDAEFSRLGFRGVFAVSAAHRRGLEALREAVAADWPAAAPEEEVPPRPKRPTRLAIVGRPNVGKSSLINALVAEPRAIVSEVAGTTRDAVDIAYMWKGEPFLFIDTAGMRQERRLHDELERAMTGRTAHAINRADVCVLVIDAATGVTMQDKKIAGLIQEAHAPCIIAVNKWDLAREQGDASKAREREYYEQVKRDMFFLSYAPVLFLSAKSGERIDGLLRTCAAIAKKPRLPLPDRAAQPRHQPRDGKIPAAARPRPPLQGPLRRAAVAEGRGARNPHPPALRQQPRAAHVRLRALPRAATPGGLRAHRLPDQVRATRPLGRGPRQDAREGARERTRQISRQRARQGPRAGEDRARPAPSAQAWLRAPALAGPGIAFTLG
ncbi:MAG: GTPase [Verrucomicrobiota bacterium]